MNYKIIKDEKALREFIEWLPQLQPDEKFYLSLFARKKYCKDLIKSADKTQLKRFLATKENMYSKIKQLECELGSYIIRDRVIEQKCLVLYINPNPRNMLKATFDIAKRALTLIQNNNIGYNIHAEAMSCVQRAKSKSYFCDFDIDSKEVDLTELNTIFPSKEYTIVETNGGYHILVHVRNSPKTKWHTAIQELYSVDKVGDQLLPVCGCTQGDFIPKFIKI